MVDDAHAARHVAGVGLRHTRVLDEGTSTRPRVHRASLAEAGNHGFTGVEHLLDLVGGDRQVVSVVGLEVRRADDAHRVVGHQDVTVGGPHAAVDDRVSKAVVHGDHDAGTGDNVDAVAVSQASDLSSPWAATVQDESAFDAHVFAAALITGHAVVGQDLGTVGLRGADGSPRHLPAVNRSVFDCERTLDARVQTGFAA